MYLPDVLYLPSFLLYIQYFFFPFLFPFFFFHIMYISLNEQKPVVEKRSTYTGSTFAVHTEHTPVFNTVHIIAAVIGVIGIIAVAIAILIICNRRKKRKKKASLDTSTNIETMTFMNQFANDFDNHVEPPKPVILIEDINSSNSPMMQQYQLQLKLHSQRHHHSDLTTTASSSSPSPPPPPYHP